MIYWSRILKRINETSTPMHFETLRSALSTLYSSGWTLEELASYCQVSKCSLRKKMLSLNIPLRKRGGVPGAEPPPEFTYEDYTLSNKELMTKYNVCQDTVRRRRREYEERYLDAQTPACGED